jgi:hypothetical protein
MLKIYHFILIHHKKIPLFLLSSLVTKLHRQKSPFPCRDVALGEERERERERDNEKCTVVREKEIYSIII